MKVYLAILKTDIDIKELKEQLKKKKITLKAHYKTIGVAKLESELPVLKDNFNDYFISVEEDKDNLTI
ncbi:MULTISPECIES: hypothetical protein [Chryseobacterium]|uniref:Uncharacterized protein n=2 Tax=Chryseobacterium TaxID=59732 RepID=A0A6N4XB01_9FLAO|nr:MULTISPECIES: hypothetical protein [Chryseobacterium]RMZ60451.1 hypothetical protein D1632_04480 [Chryseobacterium nematophagum]CAA7195639.1 hypothetical protein CHRY9293_01812 [Chryseobacterium potabilaquae]